MCGETKPKQGKRPPVMSLLASILVDLLCCVVVGLCGGGAVSDTHASASPTVQVPGPPHPLHTAWMFCCIVLGFSRMVFSWSACRFLI